MKKLKKSVLFVLVALVAVLSGWKAIDYFFLDKYAYYIFLDAPGVEEQIAEKQAALDALGVRWETKPLSEELESLNFKTGIYILRKDGETVREWEETVWAQLSGAPPSEYDKKTLWGRDSDSSSSEYDEDLVYVWQ